MLTKELEDYADGIFATLLCSRFLNYAAVAALGLVRKNDELNSVGLRSSSGSRTF